MKNLITCVILIVLCARVGAQDIHPLTLQSLFVEVYKDKTWLGSATGFVIESKTKKYLVTNWHVVTNKSPYTREWIDTSSMITPNKIKIFHNYKTRGKFIAKHENLIDSKGKPLYIEYPLGKEMADVVAIPLTETTDVIMHPVDYNENYEGMTVQPTDRVFIIGFPLGLHTSPFFPVWKSGLIASEPYFEQEGRPIISVDAMGYHGMSGSPVYMITNKLNHMGENVISDGNVDFIFMGIYNSTNENIGLGHLWNSIFLKKCFNTLP